MGGGEMSFFLFFGDVINTEDRRNANNRTGTNSHTARVRKTLQVDRCAEFGSHWAWWVMAAASLNNNN